MERRAAGAEPGRTADRRRSRPVRADGPVAPHPGDARRPDAADCAGAQPFGRRQAIGPGGPAPGSGRALHPGVRLSARRDQSAAQGLDPLRRNLEKEGQGQGIDADRARGRAADGAVPRPRHGRRGRHAERCGARQAGRVRAGDAGSQPGVARPVAARQLHGGDPGAGKYPSRISAHARARARPQPVDEAERGLPVQGDRDAGRLPARQSRYAGAGRRA